MSVVTPDEELEQRGLARWAQRSAEWTEKWFPDAYVFALAGAVLLAAAAMINGSSPVTVVQVFGDGFWDLTAFTLQMAMVVLTGYVVATAGPVARIIERVATVPKTGRGAVAFVALISCVLSLFNWGLSVVFSGLLARAIARRLDIQVDYRALGAAAYMGLGAVWAMGLSSSAAQLQATPLSLPPEILAITGVLDFGKTIFTWQSMTLAVSPHRRHRADRTQVGASGQRDPDCRRPRSRPRRRGRAERWPATARRVARNLTSAAVARRSDRAGLARSTSWRPCRP